MMQRVFPFLLTVFLVSITTEASSAQVIGVTSPGDVIVLDPTTGEHGLVGASGFGQMNSLAKDSQGRLLATSKTDGRVRLIEIDTWTFTGAHAYFTFLDNIRGLTFAPGNDDLLYAVESNSDGTVNHLYSLDLTEPPNSPTIKTLIGQTGIGNIQALVFASDGTLYGWSTSHGLLAIDPGDASTTNVSGLADGTRDIQTLYFDGAGTLHGVNKNLYTIDLGTGAYTLVAPGDFGSVRGAELYSGLCSARNYCAISPNSAGPGARIAMAGSTSVSTNSFLLIATECPPNQWGLFFFGSDEVQVPFGNGLLCVGGKIRRLSVRQTNPIGMATELLDFNQPPATQIDPFTTWKFQFWFRDPPGGGSFFNLSDGMSVFFCP